MWVYIERRKADGVVDREQFWFQTWHNLSCGLKIMEDEGWEILSYVKLPEHDLSDYDI